MGRLKTIPPRLKAAPGRITQHKPAEFSRQARRELATNSAAWRAIRAHQLANEPLCRECAKRHRITVANTCDHIDGNCNNNPADGSNYQSLCGPCHSRKTAREDGGFGNVRQA
jgi:5-methylcytosine-specific restriction protein A